MNHRKTPLRVPIMAILAAFLAAFLFGGVSRADEAQSAAEAQSSSGIVAEAQSVDAQSSGVVTAETQSSSTTTVAVADTEQSSSGSSVATATTTDNEPTSCTPRNISPRGDSDGFQDFGRFGWHHCLRGSGIRSEPDSCTESLCWR